LFGMPVALRAHGSVGKYHDIEVEDDITCLLEYANGATGVFITTTGEAPGINRLEIAAENGLLVYDTALGNISFIRNDKPVSVAIAENGPFQKPATSLSLFDEPDAGRQHAEVLENFADAILYKLPVLARAEEGIRSVELANAMIYSALNDTRVTLPLNARRYRNFLQRQIKASTFSKPASCSSDVADLSGTF
jgi:predicted dehydrogenase